MFRLIKKEQWFNNTEHPDCNPTLIKTIYKIQMKLWFFWISIKIFDTNDDEYNRICAEELYEKLDERY